MDIHTDESFLNQTVHLDGNRYIRCAFEGCQLIFSGTQPTALEHCDLQHSNFGFVGAAALTVDFLTKMYEGGFPSVVETIFDNIRGNIRS